jgi:MFS family permease
MAFTSSGSSGSAAVAVEPRWSDVYISALARAVSNCGDMLAAVALALVLQQRGEGGLAVAGILLAAAVPLVILGPYSGRLADRVDSRTLIVTIGLAQACVCVALAFVSQPALIIGLVAVLAVGLSITSPTLSALLPKMVGRENLPKAAGIGQTATTIGMLLAPALGGVLVGAFGSRVPLLIDAVTYLAIPVAGLAIRTRRGGRFREPTVVEGVGASATVAAIAGGKRGRQEVFRMRSDALMWPLFVLIGAVIAAISAVNVVDVFFIRETLHSSATVYGLVSAVWLGGMTVGAVIAARRRRDDVGTARALLLFNIATATTILVAGVVPQVAWLVPLWLLGGILNGSENVAIGVILGSRVPPEVRGHAGAMFNSIASGANAAGFLLGGALLAVASPRTLMLGCGVAGLAAAAAFGPTLVRAMRRERATAVSASTSPVAATTADAVA